MSKYHHYLPFHMGLSMVRDGSVGSPIVCRATDVQYQMVAQVNWPMSRFRIKYLHYHVPSLKYVICINLQVNGNTASDEGGGIYNMGSFTMTSSTVTIVV